MKGRKEEKATGAVLLVEGTAYVKFKWGGTRQVCG